LENVLEAEYKTKTLYKSKGSEAQKRIQEILELGLELVALTESHSEIGELNAIAILRRLIDQQTTFDSEKNAPG